MKKLLDKNDTQRLLKSIIISKNKIYKCEDEN